MESLNDVIDKRFSKPLVHFLKLVDPGKRYPIDAALAAVWDKLSLSDQRKLYLYILYRKWRGLDISGEPYFIIKNCHPVPFNWNGHPGVNNLMKSTTKMVIAKHNGSFGIYTLDEARVYEMTDIKPLNQQLQLWQK